MATVVSIPAIYKDSIIVRISTGDVYRVKRFNPKSLLLVDVEGNEFRFSTANDESWQFIREATKAEEDDFRGREFVKATAPENVFRVGNIVRWPTCTHALGRGKLMVVTKVNAEGACNLVPLGGVNTLEYFRSVPSTKLEKVDGEITVSNA